jgi:glycosyltransferase involved in cell wall biosynthesis
MPAYNNEGGIPYAIERRIKILGGLTDNYEIIVMDDWSSDRMRRVALKAALKHPNVRVVGHDRKMDKGVVFVRSYKHSCGSATVLFDVDHFSCHLSVA